MRKKDKEVFDQMFDLRSSRCCQTSFPCGVQRFAIRVRITSLRLNIEATSIELSKFVAFFLGKVSSRFILE